MDGHRGFPCPYLYISGPHLPLLQTSCTSRRGREHERQTHIPIGFFSHAVGGWFWNDFRFMTLPRTYEIPHPSPSFRLVATGSEQDQLKKTRQTTGNLSVSFFLFLPRALESTKSWRRASPTSEGLIMCTGLWKTGFVQLDSAVRNTPQTQEHSRRPGAGLG